MTNFRASVLIPPNYFLSWGEGERRTALAWDLLLSRQPHLQSPAWFWMTWRCQVEHVWALMRVEECELKGLEDGLKKDFWLCERKQCEGQNCLGVLIHSVALKAWAEIGKSAVSLLTESINIYYIFGTFWCNPCSIFNVFAVAAWKLQWIPTGVLWNHHSGWMLSFSMNTINIVIPRILMKHDNFLGLLL